MTAPKVKAVADHRPDLRDRTHVMSSSGGAWAEPVQDNFADYAKVYEVYSWVRKAVAKIAENVASVRAEVVDADG
ncbi:MAG: hypothetical protein IPM06_19665 [Rhizobiales bacterium]|nr:hypothetical protein [Hyphomicrobiales bacterium]